MSETFTVYSEDGSKEDRIAFLRKKNEARKKSMLLDWSKDKALSYNGKLGYRYLSIEKMKRNLLPVFTDCGLDFRFEYSNLIKQESASAAMSEHWILECTAILTDIDTGYSERTIVYGESADSLDKGVAKASTYALKTWLADTFMLIDGVDPDQGADNSTTRVFVPKSDKEQEEVKSKVFENAVPVPKPAAPVVTPAVPKQPEQPKAAVEPAAPKNNVPVIPGTLKDAGDPTVKKVEKPVTPKTKGGKVTIPPVPEPKMPDRPLNAAEEQIEKLKLDKLKSYKPSQPKQKAFDRAFRYYGMLGQKGEITTEFAEQMAKDRSEIGNDSEALAFIRKYEVPDDFEAE